MKHDDIMNNQEQTTQPNDSNTLNALDYISRQAATQNALEFIVEYFGGAFDENLQKKLIERINALPSAQPEVIPHRNYKYLSDYWCECGWHLGKKGEVKYCSECGRKVNWDG